MPKKKQQANPFLMFMLELRSREEAKGRKFRGMDELKNFAGPIWEKMNEEKRAPYKVQAAAAKQHRETAGKLTGVGIPYSNVAEEKREMEVNSDVIGKRISAMLHEAVEKNALDKLEVYFIALEYFCELPGGRYIPAELGAVRYSLEAGVTDQLHTHINPGSVPVGYALAVQQHSTQRHQLPVPPEALGETNYDTIAFRLFEFLTGNGAEMPLLFTDSNDVPKVESMLRDIVYDFAPDVALLVCPLSQFFYQLKKSTSQFFGSEQNNPTVQKLQLLIDQDVYDYTPNISCEYHERLGDGKHCALARCIRWAYVVSDSCCIDMSIPMQPGKHIPAEEEGAVYQLTTGLNTLSFISTIDGDGPANTPSTSRQSVPAYGKAVAVESGEIGSKAADRSINNPFISKTWCAGRGTRLKLDASREAIRQSVQGRGKLSIVDFPPLGSST